MKALRAFLAALLLTVVCSAFTQTDLPSPKIIRKQLVQALDSQPLTDSLYKILAAQPNKPALFDGYLGVIEALKAKHTWNPYYKVKFLNNAEATLQKAITRDSDNIEIRFLRFSIEHNVPGFLGYNKHLNADKDEMLKQLEKKHYGTADETLAVTIIKFLLDSKRCTPEQNQALKNHLVALK